MSIARAMPLANVILEKIVTGDLAKSERSR